MAGEATVGGLPLSLLRGLSPRRLVGRDTGSLLGYAFLPGGSARLGPVRLERLQGAGQHPQPGQSPSQNMDLDDTSESSPIKNTLLNKLNQTESTHENIGSDDLMIDFPTCDGGKTRDLVENLAAQMLQEMEKSEVQEASAKKKKTYPRIREAGRFSIFAEYFDEVDPNRINADGSVKRKRIVSCKLCAGKTLSYSNISTHMKRYHLPEEDCVVCGRQVAAEAMPGHRRSCRPAGSDQQQQQQSTHDAFASSTSE
jgi:hypothetical protein